MKSRTEDGMTILEVVIAITILLIGTGFVVQSNSVSFHYLGQQELRQQMVFFAAGAMEVNLEGPSQDLLNGNIKATSSNVSDSDLPVGSFTDLPPGLSAFKVTASVVNSPGIDNVEMYSYRYNY